MFFNRVFNQREKIYNGKSNIDKNLNSQKALEPKSFRCLQQLTSTSINAKVLVQVHRISKIGTRPSVFIQRFYLRHEASEWTVFLNTVLEILSVIIPKKNLKKVKQKILFRACHKQE